MVGSSRHAHGRVLAADLSVAGNRGPGSCVRGPPPGGPVRAKSWRCGESDVNSWRLCAGGDRRAKPARKQKARESGYGSSGRESSEGTFQGRERHETRPRSIGRHGTRSGSQGSGTRREHNEPKPSRGARTLRTAPAGVWRPSPVRHGFRVGSATARGTRCCSVRGSKNLKRGGPPSGNDSVSLARPDR